MDSESSRCPNPECGFSIDPVRDVECPKCSDPIGEKVLLGDCGELYEVDVAHQGETLFDAKQKIIEAVNHTLKFRFQGVKIIHGRGRRRGGNNIARMAIEEMKKLAKKYGGRFVRDRDNAGAHLIWFHTRKQK